MGRIRRVAVGALCALVVSGFLVTVTESPADARKVSNPASGYGIRIHAGTLQINTQGFSFVDEGRLPQCSDGTNNSDDAQDGSIDFPADGQCSNAADDSETQPGFQAKAPILLTGGTVSANGGYTFSGVSFPQQFLYVDASEASAGIISDFIVTITISPIGAVTGNVNPITGLMTLSMSVRVDLDGPNLAAACAVTPITINGATTGTTVPPPPNTPITGIGYDPIGTGRMTLVQNSYSVPGASGCGTVFFQDVNGLINDQLSLPSAAGTNSATFLSEWTPIRPLPGVTATFTALPNTGTAPHLVTFNAAGSTGQAPLTYQWDFTNNGSFDGLGGITTSNTYLTAGTHTIRLRVTDADGDSVETTRTVLTGANLPPTASDQTQSTPEDTAKAITLGGTDPEGGTLITSLVAPAPLHGTVTGTPPNVTYTPALNYNGPDSFGFRVTDNLGNFDNGLVTLNVTPVNDTPTASNVSATVVEDGSTPVTLIANDVDLTPLGYTIVDPPDKGALSGTAPNLTYTPFANEVGADSFTYQASDGSLSSNIATGSLTITPVNDAPVADDQVGANAVATTEDTAVPITLTGSDVDGNPISFGIVDPPDHGSLTGVLPNLTYTPALNYNGPDSFIFKVTDSPVATTDNGQVDITVAPANDAPTTGNVSVGTLEDTAVDFTIPSNDIDGDSLTFTPSTPTANGGTVSCAGDLCTYTPATGFTGADTFAVDVSDGTATVTSTVTVNVSDVNNTAPVINDATIVGLEDNNRSFNLVSADADGNPLTHTVLNPPATGNLTCTPGGACTFVPAANASGIQTAVVQVSDGQGGVDTAVITLNIVPINDPPTVPAQSLTTAEDTAGSIGLVSNDVDGDTVTWVVKVAPTKGSLSCSTAGACTYTPNANVNGSDSFEVEADDGKGARVRITVPVTISPVNDPPTAGTVSRSVNEDGSTSFNLIGADDGGSVTFAASPATSGALACTGAGACTFTPSANLNGTETVAYTVSDGTSTTTGSIVLTIVPVNDPPVAVSQTLTTPEDTSLPVTLAANDPDAGALTFQVTSAPAQGILGGTAPNLTYIPAPNASGTVALAFKVTDASGLTSTGTVTIVVVAVDDQPVANNAGVTTAEDTAKAIALTGSDAEGPVTTAVTVAPLHGTYASGIYTPALNYNGPDSIGFKATSNTGQVSNGTISITVTPVNDPPVATDATVSTTRTVPVAITLGGTDPDGPGTLTYTVLTGPTKGTLGGVAPNLTYTPTGFNTGSDNVTFRVTDTSGLVDSGTVGITITAGPPLATQLNLSPATAVRPNAVQILLGARTTYNNLKATLTTTGGLPIAGQSIRFTVNAGFQVCVATTNASGVATCSGKGTNGATTYQGAYAGNASYAPSTGNGVVS